MGLNFEVLTLVDGDAIDQVRQYSIYVRTLHKHSLPETVHVLSSLYPVLAFSALMNFR